MRGFFRGWDLLFPFGLSALVIGLAVWTTVHGATRGALAATWGLVAVVLTIGVTLFVVRARSRRYDYMVGNLRVRIGKRNNPPKDTVQKWLTSVTEFWGTTGYDVTKHHIAELERDDCVSGLVAFVDQYKIVLDKWDMIVRAATDFDIIIVGIHSIETFESDPEYVASLFRHEVSHLILNHCGVPGSTHHKLFKELGLGA